MKLIGCEADSKKLYIHIFIYSYIHIFIYSFGIFLQSAVDDVVAGGEDDDEDEHEDEDIVGQCTVDVDIVRQIAWNMGLGAYSL